MTRMTVSFLLRGHMANTISRKGVEMGINIGPGSSTIWDSELHNEIRDDIVVVVAFCLATVTAAQGWWTVFTSGKTSRASER
jgi:hypothetical protein